MLGFQFVFLYFQLSLNMAVIFDWTKVNRYFRNSWWVLFPLGTIIFSYLYFNFLDIPENEKHYIAGKMRYGNIEIGYMVFEYIRFFAASLALQMGCYALIFISKRKVVEEH